MEELDLKDFLSYLTKKIWIVIFITVVVFAGGFVYTNIIKKPVYSAKTDVVLISANGKEVNSSDITMNNSLVKTYAEIVTSKDVMNKVAENLNLPMSTDELINEVSTETATSTQLITITVTDHDANNSARIANEVASVFKNKIKETYSIDNISIVDKAEVPNEPSNVNPAKEYAIYVIAGIALGVILVLILYTFDTSIKDSKTVEKKLGLSVAGVVPELSSKHRDDLVVATNPKSSFAEAIKLIKTNITFSAVDKDFKVLLMTSPETGDGKSFIVANLASAFAQEGKDVLIIDADLRRGRQLKIFNVEADPQTGYSNLILSAGKNSKFMSSYTNMLNLRPETFQGPNSKNAPAMDVRPGRRHREKKPEDLFSENIYKTKIKGVNLLPSGPTPPNPLELLQSKSNRAVIDYLKNYYDVIIIDCPPSLGLSDALVMTKYSDVNMVTISNGKTTTNDLEEVKRNFARVNSKISGVIINRTKTKHSAYNSYYTNDKYYTDEIKHD